MQEDVLRLQVSVDEAHQMQVLQGSGDFGGIESGSILVDALIWSGLESSEEFAATAVFHAEVEVVFRLERVVEGNDKGVVAGG